MNINIKEIKNRNQILQELLAVWESSVKATHDFLPNEEIERIKLVQKQNRISVILV